MSALAHGPAAAGPEPAVLAVLALAAVAVAGHLAGCRRLRASAAGRVLLPPWRVLALPAGVGVAVAAVSPPAEHLAQELFAAHMVQHLVLVFLAAPLVVVARPALVTAVLLGRRGAPLLRPLRRVGLRLRDAPAVLLALGAAHVAPWLLWHVPALYDLAVRSAPVHLLEHLALLGSGAALTWLVAGRKDLAPGLLAVVAGMMTMTPVAGVLTFGRTPYYSAHDPAAWGLTRLEDQQIGGALMFFPGALPYLVAAGTLVVTRLAQPRPRPVGARP